MRPSIHHVLAPNGLACALVALAGCRDRYQKASEQARAEISRLALPVVSNTTFPPLPRPETTPLVDPAPRGPLDEQPEPGPSPTYRIVVRMDGIDIDNADLLAFVPAELRDSWLEERDFTHPLLVREREVVRLRGGRFVGMEASDPQQSVIRPLALALKGMRAGDWPTGAVVAAEAAMPAATVVRVMFTAPLVAWLFRPGYGWVDTAVLDRRRGLVLLPGAHSGRIQCVTVHAVPTAPRGPSDPLEVARTGELEVAVSPAGTWVQARSDKDRCDANTQGPPPAYISLPSLWETPRSTFEAGWGRCSAHDGAHHADPPSWESRWLMTRDQKCPVLDRREGRLDLERLRALAEGARVLAKRWEVRLRPSPDIPWGEVISVVDAIAKPGDRFWFSLADDKPPPGCDAPSIKLPP
jgi:hypothetical protein